MPFLDENGLLYVKNKIEGLLIKKVDKVDGKQLSTNDYTNEEKSKLAGIAAGAEANVNADWNAESGPQQILNKPTIPSSTSQLVNDSNFITSSDIPEGAAASNTVPKMDGIATVGTELAFARGDHIHPSDTSKVDKVEGKGLSTNDYTNEEKSKLTGIAAGAQVNVIESISVNGQVQSINTKGVNITVPTTVASLSDSGNYALKTDVTNIYKYKGTVASYENLPSEGNKIGDVYNTNDTDMNYAWNGTGWDAMGAIYEVEAITNQKIDEIFAS